MTLLTIRVSIYEIVKHTYVVRDSSFCDQIFYFVVIYFVSEPNNNFAMVLTIMIRLIDGINQVGNHPFFIIIQQFVD